MTSEQFFRYVERMRAKQKEHLRTHSSTSLRESKQLERLIDNEIERVNKIISQRQEPTLF